MRPKRPVKRIISPVWRVDAIIRGKVLKIKMSIDLRGGEVGMIASSLHTTKIAARLQHMRSEQ